MNPAVTCQRCGITLSAFSNDGLCAACMLRSVIEESEGEAAPAPPARLAWPRNFGTYELLEELGRGGMGVVYRARHRSLERIVALKLLLGGVYSSEAMVRRFQIEAAAAAALRHPGIVAIHDYGEFEGQPYYTMELMEGRNLAQVSEGRPLEARRAAQYLRDIADAVRYAHGQNILHRDLKPSNILIDTNDRARVADFGMAKRMDLTSGITLTGQVVGSPNYAAPEQVAGRDKEITVATDLYALGALLYHLLTGRPPFLAATLEETLRLLHTTEPVAPRELNAGVPFDLETICLKCLTKEPGLRYLSAALLVEDLDRYLSDRPILARPPSLAYRARKFARRNRRIVAAVSAVAISLVAGLIASTVLMLRAMVAEREVTQLLRQAETSREVEAKRASRTALALAEQLLGEDKTDEALAYFVHAARKDPDNTTIAPRLASVLTSRNFLIPQGAPFQCNARVLALRYSRDGNSLQVGTEDGVLRILEVASGRLVREFALGKPVRRGGWAFARDNEAVFAVCFADQTIAVFPIDSNQPLWSPVKIETELQPDVGLAAGPTVQLSPDGRWLCANGLKENWLWDAITGESRLKLSFPKFRFGPDFTPDGKRVAFVSEDQLRLWSLPEGVLSLGPIAIKRTTTPGMYLLPHFSPDGQILTLCDPWEGIHVLDANTGAEVRPLLPRAHTAPTSVDFLPDGRLFTAGPHTVDLYDVLSGNTTSLPLSLGFGGQVSASATGRFFVTLSNDGSPRLWDTQTGKPLAETILHQHDKFLAAVSPDGRQVVIATGAGAIHRLQVGRGRARPLILPRETAASFLAEAPAQLRQLRNGRAVVTDVSTGHTAAGGFASPVPDLTALLPDRNRWISYRPDLKFALVTDPSGVKPSQVWAIGVGRESRLMPLQDDPGSPPGGIGIAFSPQGDLVARAVGNGRKVGVWDLHTGSRVGPGCSFENRVFALYPGIDFSPDGKLLAGGLMDGRIIVWEVASGQLVTKIEPNSGVESEHVLFSPDGTRILAVNSRHEARLWDAATGVPSSPIIRSPDADSTGFSPDGRWFATWGDHTVGLWDGRTGAAVNPVGQRGAIDVCFSKDGERIVAFEATGNARVWDVHSGQPLTESMHHPTKDLQQEEFSPDGRFLLIIPGYEKLYVWAVPPSLPEGATIPEWLLQLAEACATKKINDAEECVDAPELVTQIDSVRDQLTTLPADAPLTAWGRWFLDDSPTRSIAPGFIITPTEADRLERDLPTRRPPQP